MRTISELLRFRCSGCGNCCKDPWLPLCDADVRRIAERTGDDVREFVRFIPPSGIDMDDEPESFALLRQGKRVMVLRHQRGGCRYLGESNRCSIYGARPLGCRIFPFDPSFDRRGKLRRLQLIQATECRYELDGDNDPSRLQKLHHAYEAETAAYQERVALWNQQQKARRRAGQAARGSREFLIYLGLLETSVRPLRLAARLER